MIKIDKKAAFKLLTAAMRERGKDFTYHHPDGCRYERNGKPDCLIGVALAKAGVSIEVLKGLDQCGTIGTQRATDHLIASGVRLLPNAQVVFAIAQNEQDEGHPWGRAVGLAKEH